MKHPEPYPTETIPTRPIRFVSTQHREQIYPKDIANELVFHYSIPTVQAVGTGAQEHGKTIASNKWLISDKCVLISRLNPRKATICRASPKEITTVASTEFVPLSTGNCTDDRFLELVLSTPEVTEYLSAAATSATRSHQRVSPNDITNLKVPWPTTKTRNTIVRFLDRETSEIDAFIADQERLIELLEERRAATITHAVTKGLDPNAPMKDSGIEWLGNAPEDWAIAPLKWISQLVTGTTPSTTDEHHFIDGVEGFPWIRPEDIDESGKPTVASKTLSSTGRQLVRALPPKTVLLVCIGATLGKVGITVNETSTNQQITALYGNSVKSKYLFFTLQAAYSEIRLAATGTTLPILNSSRLGAIRVPLPSVNEQQSISTYLERETSAIDAAVADAREAITLSRERRAALISAAVTGQVEVSKSPSGDSIGEALEEGVRV